MSYLQLHSKSGSGSFEKRVPNVTARLISDLFTPLLGYLINRKFNIGIHTAALTTAATLFLLLYTRMPHAYLWAGLLSMTVFFLLLPTVIWARLRLNIHTFTEPAGGILAGVAFTLFGISFLKLVW